MHKLFSFVLALMISVPVLAQNYEPSRQTIRLDAGITLFDGINKPGVYFSNSYEYAFLDRLAVEGFVNMAVLQSSSYIGEHASRVGTGIVFIGRLNGIKENYDFKLIAGARYGSSYYSVLEQSGTQVIATEGDRHSGVSPILGVGFEQHLGDWVLGLDLRMSFETQQRTYSNISVGLGYRF